MNTVQKAVCWAVCAVALTACALPAGNPYSAPSARSVQTDKASDAVMTAMCDKIRNSNDPKLKAAMGQSCVENGY